MKALWLFLRRQRREIVGVALVCAAGLIFLALLRSKSLDYLFAMRGTVSTNRADFPDDVAVVFLEDAAPGDWRPYTDFLTSLSKANSPKAVVFDFLFTRGDTNQTFVDFCDAIKDEAKRTKILFVTDAVESHPTSRTPVWTVTPLLPGLSTLVSELNTNVAVGLAIFPREADGVVRRYYGTDLSGYQPLAFAVARLLNGHAASGDFCINYYGPPGALKYYYSKDTLSAKGGLSSYLEGRVVFVGEGPAVTNRIPSLDRHKTPFGRSETNTSSGVEIHATAYANLVHGATVRGFGGLGEGFLVLVVGVACGVWFVQWTPRYALGIAGTSCLLVGAFSFLLFKYAHSIVPWLAMVAIQLPTAFAVSFLPVKSAFISHRSPDNSTAARIASGLNRLGIEVYLAFAEEQSGDLEVGLLDEVEKRSAFILVVTPSLSGFSTPPPPDWVGEEIARAIKLEKEILLVNVDLCLKDLTGKSSAILPYDALYTKTKDPQQGLRQRVVLSELLATKFQAQFLTGAKDPSSFVTDIAGKVKWSLRRDWLKRASTIPYG